jgi:hypothetical protein
MINDKEFMSKLWSRICDQIPVSFESYKVCGLNERLRFLRSDSGDYFKRHCDECYLRPDGSELSLITIKDMILSHNYFIENKRYFVIN